MPKGVYDRTAAKKRGKWAKRVVSAGGIINTDEHPPKETPDMMRLRDNAFEDAGQIHMLELEVSALHSELDRAYKVIDILHVLLVQSRAGNG